MKKKIISVTLLLTLTVLLFTLGITSYETSFENSVKSSVQDTENITDEKDDKSLVTGTVITDQEEIEEFAEKHNIPLFIDGEKIKKIETEVTSLYQKK